MKELLERMIYDYVNDFAKESRISWREPIIGYARADDPLFGKLKEVVTPAHSLPQDILEEANTVIAYFLPFTKDVMESNLDGRHSSKIWGVAYVETNRLINEISRYLAEALISRGYKAASIPTTRNFDPETMTSDWSYRSAAYIAGLGTFGLNHMLITESGCCGRVGSLVTDLVIEPTLRYESELCLHKVNGSCARCVAKCVNNSLQENELDKQRCYKMLQENADRLKDLQGPPQVCGKCMVGVPCATAIPQTKK
ncbi:MAG: epoxyqueuosine reductase [Bacillota bacterium]